MEILDLLSDFPAAYLAAMFIMGLLVGSFLNVLILRLPARMEQDLREACADFRGEAYEPLPNGWFGLQYLITPASHCPNCGHTIRAWENIPVLSYLLLRGRCAGCRQPIAIRYPIVELVTALFTLAVAAKFGLTWQAGAALLLTWGLLASSMIDIDHQLLPDVLILPLLWLGLLLNQQQLFAHPDSALLGAAIGYLSLWFIYHLFKLITGKEGMGYGDFKLYALFGAWLGWQMLPQILLLSTLVGAVVGIALIAIRGRDRNIPIPFGPYLAAAGWIALLWGDEINQTYLQLAGLG